MSKVNILSKLLTVDNIIYKLCFEIWFVYDVDYVDKLLEKLILINHTYKYLIKFQYHINGI